MVGTFPKQVIFNIHTVRQGHKDHKGESYVSCIIPDTQDNVWKYVVSIIYTKYSGRKSCISQDLILQDFSRKTLDARLARQIFTKKLCFSGQKWSIFTKLFKWEQKKKFLIIFFMLGRILFREIHCFHTSNIFYSEIN